MTSKHTKGPWEHHDNGVVTAKTATVQIASTRSIARIAPKREECEANARLIAAAPDLLKALDRAVQDIDSGWADEAEKRFPWLEDARAASAKAKGERT